MVRVVSLGYEFSGWNFKVGPHIVLIQKDGPRASVTFLPSFEGTSKVMSKEMVDRALVASRFILDRMLAIRTLGRHGKTIPGKLVPPVYRLYTDTFSVALSTTSLKFDRKPHTVPPDLQPIHVPHDFCQVLFDIMRRIYSFLRSLQRKNVLYPLPNKPAFNHAPEWRRVTQPLVGNGWANANGDDSEARVAAAAKWYGLSTKVGSGGFGTVFRAVPTPQLLALMSKLRDKVPARPMLPFGAEVAVKVQPVSNNDEVRRAVQESKVHRRLMAQTVGVVPRLYASGYDTTHKVFVSAMEMVKGVSLSTYLKRGRLSASMFVKIERAITSMWRAGIAHVDLNPENIMVLPNGRVTIIDFGLSRSLPKHLVPKTNANATKPDYQQKLMDWIDAQRKRNGVMRVASDPHILRWLYWHVHDKKRIPRFRP